MSDKSKPKGFGFWLYSILFIVDVIGFGLADYRDNVQQMVWCGFFGLLWFRMAEKEGAA